MNIFVLHEDPEQAAWWHCDKHVLKMTIEYGQLLSGAQRAMGNDDRRLFLITHSKHPCSLWTRASQANYDWLLELFFYTAMQYQLRYEHVHSVYARLKEVLKTPIALPDIGMTPFVQAMPAQYRQEDPVAAYRAYYRGEKRHFARWTSPATIPVWFIEGDITSKEVKRRHTGTVKIVQTNLKEVLK